MITLSEYAERRQRLLAKMSDHSVCVLAAAREVTRSRDTEYPFRQDSDFCYLTGFNEPEALLVLSKTQTGQESVLFCREKDPQAEIWQGRRLGPQAAPRTLGVDQAFSLEEADERLLALLDGCEVLYFAQGHSAHLDQRLFGLLDKLRSAPKKSRVAPRALMDVRDWLHEMRLLKSAAEIALMRRAAEISAQAHQRAMRFCRPGRLEYQLEAELHHEFAMQGARHPAYGTIVGGGINACVLHYTQNSDELRDGDLVLIDAGAELQGYAADITRTFPVSGRFSQEQATLYQLVLDAQLAAFEHIRPRDTLAMATDAAARVICAGLLKLGILSGTLEQNLEQKAYRQYFMHGLGHWLGLDVHDVGDYKLDGQDRPFEPGMVLTVEPGIYIAQDAQVDPKWRGIGIRIEDNLLVTAAGYENLTVSAPKQISEIETLMATESKG
ncbi:Xaa-Pro aminopeptidase [Bowmanella dokdonensis]|uniref:Xaa-Pro aminopeptidase n=1 Tax=Bowmanella dokdonensis TaxID=751969 RepID=A0A939DMN6_9ALTE|nr:Xaa-Pro aminopeptidase [Bowmanella dokdonensis]MBN7825589.1 Xaa-Pro aminopeptidase [Bowmanella dokdonensis]